MNALKEKKLTWNPSRSLGGALALGLALALSACGSNPYHESALAEEGVIPGTITDTTGTTVSNPTPVTTDPNLLPSLKYSFDVTGSKGSKPVYSVTVQTDNLLKVKLTSEAAGAQTLSGFTANYDCVTYTISALGNSVTTSTLSAGGTVSVNCPNAPTNQVIDFSDRLQPGHGPVTIEVRADRYDFYYKSCLSQPWLYGWNCMYYYPLYNVYQNHIVRGKLAIQVNGTNL
ncbi:MAG: hypothetical protein NDJ89_15640 [Oligoflexia bacterium]|nr:hypothetical protein [Oligoflexia bacterium]